MNNIVLQRLSPPQRLPLGIPIKISIIEKIESAGDDGKRETAGASLLSSPFPSCPARSLFLSPQPPHNTKASPQYKKASAEERVAKMFILHVYALSEP